MKVALVQPPHSYDGTFSCLPTFQIGLGMLSIRAYLERLGHEVHIFHFPWAQLKGIRLETALRELASCDPQIVAIGLNWLHFSAGAIETARRIKERLPQCTVLIGGQHASLFSREIIERHSDCVDAVLHGEAEVSFAAVAGVIASDGRIPDGMAGVVTLRSDIPEGGVARPDVVADLDSLPFFFADRAWPGYPNKLIGAPKALEGLLGSFSTRAAIDTVRGSCPRDCCYCIGARIGAIQGRCGLVAHSPAWLLEHIRLLRERGIESITIQDPFFILGDEPMVALCEGLLRQGSKLRALSVFVEPGAYCRETLALMRKTADTVLVEFGIETGSRTVAHAIGRETDYNRILSNLIEAREAGVVPVSWWMVGLPSEGVAEIQETMDFIRTTMQEGIVPAQVTPMVLFPHTRLAQEADERGIDLQMRSFADFSRFSHEPLNETGTYPNLITHSTTQQSVDDTVRHNRRIKQLFVENWAALEARFEGGPHAAYLNGAKHLLTYRYY